MAEERISELEAISQNLENQKAKRTETDKNRADYPRTVEQVQNA